MTGVDVDGYVVDLHVVCTWSVYLVVELDASMAADCTPRLRLGEVVVVVDLAERTCGTDDTCYARHVTGPRCRRRTALNQNLYVSNSLTSPLELRKRADDRC